MSKVNQQRRTSYNKITEETRLQILDRILNLEQNLKEVAFSMNVNVSTCKAIIKVFQQQGRIGKKQKRNKVHNVVQTFTFLFVKDNCVQQVGDIQINQSKVSFEKGQNLDQILKENAKVKAEEMLEKVAEEKKKEESDQLQRNMMQYWWIQNGMSQVCAPLNNHPIMHASETIVKQQADVFGSGSRDSDN